MIKSLWLFLTFSRQQVLNAYCHNIYSVSESLFFACPWLKFWKTYFLSHYLIYISPIFVQTTKINFLFSSKQTLNFRFLDKVFGLRIQSKAAEQSFWHTFKFDFTKGLIPMWSFTLPIYSEGGFPHCISNG